MQNRANKTKALLQDLAGYRLTVLMVLFLNNRPMQNLELSDWIGKGDKPLAGYLDYLETHRFVERTFHGWKLCKDVRQLDFLKELLPVESETLRLDGAQSALRAGVGESPTLVVLDGGSVDNFGGDGFEGVKPFNHLNGIGAEHIKESEKVSESESFLSTPPTTTTDHDLTNNNDDHDLGKSFAEILGEMDKEELKAIKVEIVKMCIGEHEAYNALLDDESKTPQFIFGHYLQLMREDRHWNKSLLIEHILNRAVHPHYYKQACKMIVNGDY